MTKEIWRTINGFEGLYEVSSLGRVRSLDRYVKHPDFKEWRKGKVLKQSTSNRGYKKVTLTKNGQKYYFSVHRLVAQSFVPNPHNFPQVNHKNEEKDDNRVENLEWCTQAYNNSFGTRLKRVSKANSQAHPTRSVFQYNDCGVLIHRWKSLHEMERQTGYSRANISRNYKGGRRRAYGFLWEILPTTNTMKHDCHDK